LNAEILCIGTELLLGETINTNASYIAKNLAKIGIDCFYVTTVGDNKSRVKSALDVAFKRADIVITTGGLGPTEDDLTVETCAEFFGQKLISDEQSVNDIKKYFEQLQKTMPVTNLKQAKRPEGSCHIRNTAGTAPGLLWEIKQADYSFLDRDKIILCFPGVPSELYFMWENFVEGYLRKFSDLVLITEHLKFESISEALLAEKVKDFLDQQNPTVAPLVNSGEATLRIASKADNYETAQKLLDKTKNNILSLVGQYYYASDNENIENVVGNLLAQKGLTLSVAESCTGGLVSSRLTDVAGSSTYTRLNIVTYSNNAKINILGVNQETLNKFGAVSEETAKEMAEGMRKYAKTDIAISVTGVAGPTGGTPEKPIGLVFVGIADDKKTEVYKIMHHEGFSRKDIKFLSSQKTLQLLRKFVVAKF
jgi:nicotinamide-nucleotide amidase